MNFNYTEKQYQSALARNRQASQDRLVIALAVAALFGVACGMGLLALMQWVMG
jgi:hypothetical protein